MAKQKEAESQNPTPEVVAPASRGRAWKLADGVDVSKFRGQAAEVLKAIQESGGGTVDEIAAIVEFANFTRQTPKRIVAYYVSLFKSDGKLVPAN